MNSFMSFTFLQKAHKIIDNFDFHEVPRGNWKASLPKNPEAYTQQRLYSLLLWKKILLLLLLIGNFTYYCLVFAIFKGDCIIPIHDTLDNVNAWFEMFRQNNLFGAIDQPTPCFLGLSTLNYAHINFSLHSLLYVLFNNFTAFALNYIIAFILSFIGMTLLLESLIDDNTFLNLIVALLYAGLPAVHIYAMGAATMPFLFLALRHFYSKDKPFDCRVLLLFFFPCFGHLTGINVFLLAIWALATIIRTIQKRVVPVNLLTGFFVMCVGSILVEWRLFYSVLFGPPLNRSIMSGTPNWKTVFSQFRTYFQWGWYHLPSAQHKLVLPVTVIFFILFLAINLASKAGIVQTSKFRFYTEKDGRLLLWSVTAIFINCIIGGLYSGNIFNHLIGQVFSSFIGFNWGRFWILNRCFWYIAFAICLKAIARLPKCQIAALAIAIAQMFIIATDRSWTHQYNYAGLTWVNELIRKPKNLPPSDAYISYDDFYAVELFEEIKQDLNYTNEHVAAVGYHPAVLMFNGFHCVDGYLNAYEISYMQSFRTLIKPELDQNNAIRSYYDGWGGRMYLYNDEAGDAPTYQKIAAPITLNINPVVARETFGLRWILSRAPIDNTNELGLLLVREYHTNGLYDIYVYELI